MRRRAGTDGGLRIRPWGVTPVKKSSWEHGCRDVRGQERGLRNGPPRGMVSRRKKKGRTCSLRGNGVCFGADELRFNEHEIEEKKNIGANWVGRRRECQGMGNEESSVLEGNVSGLIGFEIWGR